MIATTPRIALVALLGIVLFLFYHLSTYDYYYPSSTNPAFEAVVQQPPETSAAPTSSTSADLDSNTLTSSSARKSTTVIKEPSTPTVESTSSTSSTNPDSQATSVALTKTLVVARLKKADTSWIDKELPDVPTAIYVVDDPSAELTVPKNKGHEAMVYLTYIIDHYDNLTDVSIFTHSDQITWHNNDLADSDLVKMINRLDLAWIQKLGYANLRCHQGPGCPEGLHLDQNSNDINRPEQVIFKTVWPELHPLLPVPTSIAHPCCAQFAVSRDAIYNHPREQYLTWREWLLNTKLEDRISGRIWEYTWHFIFTGQNTVCLPMHLCYCEGYSICFKSYKDSDDFWKYRDDRRKIEDEFKDWRKAHDQTNKDEDLRHKAEEYEAKLREMEEELDRRKAEAFTRGDDSWEKQKALGQNTGDG